MLTYQWGNMIHCWLGVAQQLHLCRIAQRQNQRGMLVAHELPILKLIILWPLNSLLLPSIYDDSL